MTTKEQWLAYLKQLEWYGKALKHWVHNLPDEGVVNTADEAGPGSNPPPPPPPPPPH